MILVTVGTHEQPFDRLVRAADALAEALDEAVVVQTAATRVLQGRAERIGIVAPSRLEALVDDARIVVTHAGPATIDLVLARGRVPIVVPRRPEHGEHVDDHQVRFVGHLAGRVHVLPDPAGLLAAVRCHGAVEAGLLASAGCEALGWSGGRGEAVAEGFGAVVREVVAAPSGRGGRIRATLMRFLGPLVGAPSARTPG